MAAGYDIAVWTHRCSDYLERAIASVGKYAPGSYNLIVVCEPGNCHENMARALARAQSRFFFFMDEDVELLNDFAIPSLITALEMPEIGMVYPNEVMNRLTKLPDSGLIERPWSPAYFMGVDREAVPDLAVDTEIPGLMGMTDVDLSYQVADAGLKIVQHTGVSVLHEKKGGKTQEYFEQYQLPDMPTRKSWYPAQVRHIHRKWKKNPHNENI